MKSNDYGNNDLLTGFVVGVGTGYAIGEDDGARRGFEKGYKRGYAEGRDNVVEQIENTEAFQKGTGEAQEALTEQYKNKMRELAEKSAEGMANCDNKWFEWRRRNCRGRVLDSASDNFDRIVDEGGSPKLPSTGNQAEDAIRAISSQEETRKFPEKSFQEQIKPQAYTHLEKIRQDRAKARELSGQGGCIVM